MNEMFMGIHEVEGTPDPVEKMFGKIALEQGFLLSEAEMVKLPGKKQNKWDKMSTVPDFLIKRNEGEVGIYVEVTVKNEISGGKNCQRKVMEAAGLGERYVQLSMPELDAIRENGLNLMDYLEEKIAKRKSGELGK